MMMILQRIFLILSLITSYSHSYSIQVPDGDTVECTNIKTQRAFDHNLLKNHKLQNDTYTTGCYNLECPGFVQTSNTIILGGIISPVSTYGGKQFEITISIWKDKLYGNWWLSLGPNNSMVGYWPGEIFGNLTNHAEEVQWGGEILNRQRFGRHTTTQMGSGHFPDEGFSKSSYFRNLKVVDSNNDFRQVEDIDILGHNKLYDIKAMFSNDSGASSLGLSSFLFYFSFIIFLMF